MTLTSLTFTDRSRYFKGTQQCPTLRYLEFHSGPSGYGIRPTLQAVPLATGIRLHRIMAKVMRLMAQQVEPNSLEEAQELVEGLSGGVGEILVGELHSYQRYCLLKGGFQPEEVKGLEKLGEEAQRVILEQSALMAGLVWAFLRMRLPALLHNQRIILIEEEGDWVEQCDCGLTDGVGDFTEHGERGCGGIGLATRPDLILERKFDGSLGNVDWKTLSVLSEPWVRGWLDNIQMTIGTAAAERKLGRRIQHYYIYGMVKGQRKKGWTGPNEYNGPKSQQSDFCYVEVRRANPPLNTPKFDNRGKWNEKHPTWEAPFPVDVAGLDPIQALVTRLYWWAHEIRSEDLTDLFPVIGPHNHSDHLLQEFRKGLRVEENLWRARTWALYEASEERGVSPLSIMNEFIPPSWQCHMFSRDCTMIPICYRYPGWEDPLTMQRDDGSPRYELRAPHHVAEAEQAKERGIELPVDEDFEEEE